jgi:hypothetical protein
MRERDGGIGQSESSYLLLSVRKQGAYKGSTA